MEWKTITREELLTLYRYNSVRAIAEKFGVTKAQVNYKFKKFDINMYAMAEEQLLDHFNNDEDFCAKVKKVVGHKRLALIATRFAFREGPAEDMREAGKLSPEDASAMENFFRNRLCYMFKLMEENNYFGLFKLAFLYKDCGTDLDEPVPDDGGLSNLKLEKYSF